LRLLHQNHTSNGLSRETPVRISAIHTYGLHSRDTYTGLTSRRTCGFRRRRLRRQLQGILIQGRVNLWKGRHSLELIPIDRGYTQSRSCSLRKRVPLRHHRVVLVQQVSHSSSALPPPAHTGLYQRCRPRSLSQAWDGRPLRARMCGQNSVRSVDDGRDKVLPCLTVSTRSTRMPGVQQGSTCLLH